MRLKWPPQLLVLAAFADCFGCTPGPKNPDDALQPASAPVVSDRIQVRESGQHPRLTLVERLGDPKAALAIAVAHDHGSEASVALSALLERRLSNRGYPTVRRQAHALGFQLASLVSDEQDAQRFLLAARAALEAPIGPTEPGLELATRELQGLKARTLGSDGALASAACSGELAVSAKAQLLSLDTASGRAALDKLREQLVNATQVAFAAVGPRSLLDAIAKTQAQGPDWPDRGQVQDPWPDKNVTSIATESGVKPEVSIALRVADPSRAIQAAQALGGRKSRLKQQLSALVPEWSLVRSVATARVRGACLRLDMQLDQGAPSVVDEVARVAFLAEREAERALAAARADSFILDQRVLMAADPRDAAGLAAWRAHISRQPTGPIRRVVHVLARPNLSAKATPALGALLSQFAAGKATDLERRVTVEPGQGEVWMLLASRCGPLQETADSAGHSALLLHALASQANLRSDVVIEPWVTPYAAGLLAHAPRRNAQEPPARHAERVGRALAEAFSLTPVTFRETALARETLLRAIGPDPRVAWWQAVEALAPAHPSILAPWGTFRSVSEAGKASLEQRHHALLSEPLRVAIIANGDAAQAEAGLRALEQWLAPMRGDTQTCPTAGLTPPKLGHIEIASTEAPSAATAYVGMRAPSDAAAARATQYLLNRKSGWLDQALSVPGLVTNARAHLLGGPQGHGIIIEVRALDAKLPQAIDQVRGLLSRLARGASTSADVKLAQRQLSAEETLAQLNPRGRILKIWREPGPEAPLTLERLRDFQRALADQHHLVVAPKLLD